MIRRSSRRDVLRGALGATLLAACGRDEPADETLVVAGYSAIRDALDRLILPAFRAARLATSGKHVRVTPSYAASGAQSRAVAAGFEADVVMLAIEPDVERLEKAKLVTHAWRPGASFATTLVALAVRPGNPRGVTSFADLARPGLELLMPSPKTSGGAMWNVSALWGAAMRGDAGVPANDPEAADRWLRAVLKNVILFDKGARESMITFDKGVGDVALTYESEIVAGRKAGRRYDEVLPRGTIVVETPGAVVDTYAEKHGARELATAFLEFVHSNAAQRSLAELGFRPVLDGVSADASLPAPERTFRIAELGGFREIVPKLFADGGVFPRALDAATSE